MIEKAKEPLPKHPKKDKQRLKNREQELTDNFNTFPNDPDLNYNSRGAEYKAQRNVYNALNSGVILTQVQTFGSALDRPATILQGRLMRFGVQARW